MMSSDGRLAEGLNDGLVAREHSRGSLSHERRLRVASRRLNSLWFTLPFFGIVWHPRMGSVAVGFLLV